MPATSHNLLAIVEEMNRGCMATKGFNTRQNYLTAARSISLCFGYSLTIEELTADKIADYQSWLKRRGICLNTISCYMRSLKTIYNRAARDFHIPDQKPFDNAFTGRAKTEKRAITASDIKKIASLALPNQSPEALARDMFLFSIYAMGMPFVDMVFLKKSQIKDGGFSYFRHKTRQRIHVAVEPCMQALIDKYLARCSGEYLFPILDSSVTRDVDAVYAAKLAQYNRLLSSIAAKAHIPKLTSYIARHTWASIAYSENVDLNVISKGMGHTNTNTTLVYVKEINDSRLAVANAAIIERLTV